MKIVVVLGVLLTITTTANATAIASDAGLRFIDMFLDKKTQMGGMGMV